MMPDYNQFDNVMPLTLEEHFRQMAEKYASVKNLYSLWNLLKKDLVEQTEYSLSTFVHYSVHNVMHSLAIIQAVERFLGDDRIRQLTPTDTFMMLCCAYAHDYGMAITFNHYYRILGTQEFQDFLNQKTHQSMEPEEVKAMKYLTDYLKGTQEFQSIQEMYLSIVTVMEMYQRPKHAEGVHMLWNDFEGLLQNRLKGRFVQGKEGIFEICESHGKPFSSIMEMSARADGIVGDNYHPRQIAAMLRLGDLLDLDNGRFPRWFVMELARTKPLIPKLSILNYYKHQSISHLMITPKKIEIDASCDNPEYGYETAYVISEWLDWLEEECENQTKHWAEITQTNFGRPPYLAKRDIYIDGQRFTAGQHKLQLIMPQERMMKLLKGTSIYNDRYVCIREVVQNAIDASLLRLWKDITENRYLANGVDKYGRYHAKNSSNQTEDASPLNMWELNYQVMTQIIANYDITVELILDRSHEHYDRDVVLIVVKDRGLGILPSDVEFMTKIGSQKEENKRVAKLMKSMPGWLKPSGVFGIGLQSVFQLTDQIEFYSRVPGNPERNFIFHSYGHNKGRVEIREVNPTQPVIFADNSLPGTNFYIRVDPEKVLGQNDSNHLFYYDKEFSPAEDVDILFEEMRGAIERTLLSNRLDYFNIFFQTMEIFPKDRVVKHDMRRMRYSFFCPLKDMPNLDKMTAMEREMIESSLAPFMGKSSRKNDITERDGEYFFQYSKQFASMIDGHTNRIYRLAIRPCVLNQEENSKRVELPETLQSPYHFQYKFSNLEDLCCRVNKPSESAACEIYVQILDDDTTKYVNIDREHLRKTAISQKELDDAIAILTQHWCNALIREEEKRKAQVEQKNKKGMATKKRCNKEAEFRKEEYHPKYDKQMNQFISLAMLFYQNVSFEAFQKFLKPYQVVFNNQKILLGDENFPIQDIWNPKQKFYYQEGEGHWADLDGSNQIHQLHRNVLRKMPHHIFQVDRINGSAEGGLCYYLKDYKLREPPTGIQMNEAAIDMDYAAAMGFNPSKPKKRYLESVVHKVFKPNQKFEGLIIQRIPKHFSKGSNYSEPVTDYIDGYILSPFDRDMTSMLLQLLLKQQKNTGAQDAFKIRKDMAHSVNQIAEESIHFNRCVDYTYQQRMSYYPSNNERRGCTREAIRKEFLNLIADFCRFLISDPDVVI